jgi:hypothetical protein
MNNTFKLNQFTITNKAGFIDYLPQWSSVRKQILPTSTAKLYPATLVKLLPTGYIDKATATDLGYGFVYYNDIFNEHTATNNFNIPPLLREGDYITLLADGVIEAGDELEFSPQSTGQDKVKKSAGTNPICAIADEPAIDGGVFKAFIKFKKI